MILAITHSRPILLSFMTSTLRAGRNKISLMVILIVVATIRVIVLLSLATLARATFAVFKVTSNATVARRKRL